MTEKTWRKKAQANIYKWGMQDLPTLALVLAEETGEVARAILQYQHEDGDYCAISREIDDAGAVLIQMKESLKLRTLKRAKRRVEQ